MSADYRNTEGYADPTAFGAMLNIRNEEKSLRSFRPLVYISCPADTEAELLKRYCRCAVDNDAIPVLPRLLFDSFMGTDTLRERQLTDFFSTVLQSKCVELWVFGSEITETMEEEISYAERKHSLIRYFSSECKELCPTKERSK